MVQHIRLSPPHHGNRLTVLLVLTALAGGCRSGCEEGPPPERPGARVGTAAVLSPPPGVALEENFRPGGKLDPLEWVQTRQYDFQEVGVELVPDPERAGRGRLRLRAATVGTDDRTVKRIGVVHARPIDLRQPTSITVEMDWAKQANGSYLSQELCLSPTWTTESPEDTPNWIAFRWVGVPPGHEARPEVMRRTHGNMQVVEQFGWPEQQPGRELGRSKVTLEFQGRALKLYLDDKLVSETEDAGFRFDQAYLYLSLITHSNYTLRELFFDRVEVRGTLLPPQPLSPAPEGGEPAAATGAPAPTAPTEGTASGATPPLQPGVVPYPPPPGPPPGPPSTRPRLEPGVVPYPPPPPPPPDPATPATPATP